MDSSWFEVLFWSVSCFILNFFSCDDLLNCLSVPFSHLLLPDWFHLSLIILLCFQSCVFSLSLQFLCVCWSILSSVFLTVFPVLHWFVPCSVFISPWFFRIASVISFCFVSCKVYYLNFRFFIKTFAFCFFF